MEISLNTVESIMTYHTQEGNKDQRYFGHCPGHFEVALGFLSNSLDTTICSPKMTHLFPFILARNSWRNHRKADAGALNHAIGIGSDFLKIVKNI